MTISFAGTTSVSSSWSRLSRVTTLVAAAALSLLHLAPWAEAASAVKESPPAALFQAGEPDLYRATGACLRAELVLEKALPDGKPLLVFLHGATGGKFTTGWAQGLDRRQENLPYGLVADGVRLDGKSLQGSIRGDTFCPELALELKAQVRDNEVGGTYQGFLMGWTREYRVQKTVMEGALNGRLLAEDELRRRNALAAGREYPCYRGPFGSGSAADCGQELVKSFAEARLVWKSEENSMPGAWSSGGWGNRDSNYGGVAVADGKVYVYYSCQVLIPQEKPAANPQPAPPPSSSEQAVPGPHVEWTKNAQGIPSLTEVRSAAAPEPAWTPSDPYRGPLRMSKALDRVLCLDAATGRTLWRASWPGLSFVLKAANHTTPCVAEGKVVVQSGMFMIYALDANTGAMLWSNADTFRAVGNFEKLRDKPVGQHAQPVNSGSPVIADGVVMVYGSMRKGGGAGLDLATGRLLWQLVGARPRLRWTHRGKQYFIAGNRAIEPRTGRVLWSIGERESITAVCEDYLITGAPLSCYRITPQEAVRVWTLPWKHASYHAGPVIYREHAYVSGTWTDGRKSDDGASLSTPQEEPPEPGQDNKTVNRLLCVHLPTGKVLGAKGPVGGTCYEMLAADGLIIHQQYGQLWRAAPDVFELVPGRPQAIIAASAAPAAVADGRYFARLDRNCMGLVCYDLRRAGR